MRLFSNAARAGVHTVSICPGWRKQPGVSAPTDWFQRVTDSNGASFFEPLTMRIKFDPKVDDGAIDVPDELGRYLLENGFARKKAWDEKVLFTMEAPPGPRFRANHEVAA